MERTSTDSGGWDTVISAVAVSLPQGLVAVRVT